MRRTPGRGPSLRPNPPCSLPLSPTLPLSRPRSPLSSRPRFVKRASRVFAFGRFLAGPIKDSGFRIGEEYSRCAPYSSTARNDGPSRSRSTYHYAHGLPHRHAHNPLTRHARVLLSGHPVHFSRHDPEFSEFFAATRLDTPGGRWSNHACTNQARNPLCRVTC